MLGLGPRMLRHGSDLEFGINAELAANDRRTNSASVIVAGGGGGAKVSLNRVGLRRTRRNFNIHAELEIRSGFPLRVMINKDLVLD